MDKLDELRAAAMAGPNIADYDHAAIARYLTALHPTVVLALLDAADTLKAAREQFQQIVHCGNEAKCNPCRNQAFYAVKGIDAALAKLK